MQTEDNVKYLKIRNVFTFYLFFYYFYFEFRFTLSNEIHKKRKEKNYKITIYNSIHFLKFYLFMAEIV